MCRFTIDRYVVRLYAAAGTKNTKLVCKITLWKKGAKSESAYLTFLRKKQQNQRCTPSGVPTAFFRADQLQMALALLQQARSIDFFCEGSGPSAVAGLETSEIPRKRKRR
jgi:hypothetical protein